MSEVEAALTPCAATGLLVAPVAVEVNPDGSTILVYCNAGKDMLDVFNDLHDAGDAAALRKNMLHFLASVLLALHELHKQVGLMAGGGCRSRSLSTCHCHVSMQRVQPIIARQLGTCC